MTHRRTLATIVISLLTLASTFAGFAADTQSDASQGSRRRHAVQPPVAVAPNAHGDSYSVVQGQAITVNGSNSVLMNDVDPQGKPLTAVLVANPAHGNLSFKSDGTFTYANDGAAVPVDTFMYKVSDGTNESAPAMVTINIIPEVLPRPAFSFQVSYLDVMFTDSSNGNIASWSWNFGDNTTSNQRSPAHGFTYAGTYTVTLTVTNVAGSATMSHQVRATDPSGYGY